MKIKCTVTGIPYNSSLFPESKARFSVPHSIFSFSLSQLHQLEQSAKTIEEQWLIAFAYSQFSPLIKISPAFPAFPSFPIAEYFPILTSIAKLKSTDTLPSFHLSPDSLDSFIPYLCTLPEAKQSRPLSVSEYDSVINTLSIDQDIERARYLRSKNALIENITWAIDALLPIPYFTEADYSDLKAILLGNKERVSAIRIAELKHMCLDSLPEYTQHEVTRKESIIAILTKQAMAAPKTESKVEKAKLLSASFSLLTSTATPGSKPETTQIDLSFMKGLNL